MKLHDHGHISPSLHPPLMIFFSLPSQAILLDMKFDPTPPFHLLFTLPTYRNSITRLQRMIIQHITLHEPPPKQKPRQQQQQLSSNPLPFSLTRFAPHPQLISHFLHNHLSLSKVLMPSSVYDGSFEQLIPHILLLISDSSLSLSLSVHIHNRIHISFNILVDLPCNSAAFDTSSPFFLSLFLSYFSLIRSWLHPMPLFFSKLQIPRGYFGSTLSLRLRACVLAWAVWIVNLKGATGSGRMGWFRVATDGDWDGPMCVLC